MYLRERREKGGEKDDKGSGKRIAQRGAELCERDEYMGAEEAGELFEAGADGAGEGELSTRGGWG